MLGVPIEIAVRDPDAARAAAAIEQAYRAARRTGEQLLASHTGSEIDVLNRVPSQVWIEVAPETAAALRRAHEIAQRSEGAFDPTDPPLQKLWGVDRREPRTPRDFEIEMALRHVYWENVELDAHAPLVRRSGRRTVVDLGDFARGAMLDAALDALRAGGVPAARASAGSVHAVYGGTRKRPWRLALPAHHGAAALRAASLDEGGFAYAAPILALRAPDGTRIHELIDPRSGRPALDARFAAVAANDARSAAAYARALFMMGRDAPAFARSHPQLRTYLQLTTGETLGDVDDLFHSPTGE